MLGKTLARSSYSRRTPFVASAISQQFWVIIMIFDKLLEGPINKRFREVPINLFFELERSSPSL